MKFLKAIFGASLAFLPMAVSADNGAENMARAAAEALIEASISLENAERAKDRIAALTETVRAYEAGLASMREGLRQVTLKERALGEGLEAQEENLATLLAVLQNIKRAESVTGILHPEGALPAIRAGILTGAAVPEMNAQAKSLASELEDASALIALRRASETRLQEGLNGILDARLALTKAVSERSDLPENYATDQAAMMALFNSAESLSAFADEISEDSPWAEVANENWPMPVRGRLIRGFNEAAPNGTRRPGWTIATESAALVSAPVSGTIRFTGQLENYDGVLILEPRAGEMMILAGVNEVFVRRGQVVKAGEALALMGGVTPSAQEILIETAQGSGLSSRETLYIEVRHDREAIDPASRFDPVAE